MDKKNKNSGRYKLICTINNDKKDPFIITSGNLCDIDKFIFENKIKNSDDLYNVFSNLHFEGDGTYEFNLTYRYNGEKELPILYYDDISKINNVYSAVDEIKNSFLFDDKFFRVFMDQSVKPIARMKNNNKLKKYAKDLCDNPKDIPCLERFLYSYISKLEPGRTGDDTMTPTEKLEAETPKYIVYYTKLRNLYTTVKYLHKEYEHPIIEDEVIYDDKNIK